ncbi:ABC transporter ATP-binding protein [Allorhizobium sp. BGMRC 0089]|uniref:ABC transporter ATP-binding protein n=1 Tax=Allorhizobium sonneratiae TaxID=2934936 RepID=UPI0020344748|nr:ABC transporter ATP-binding protein [Allorhizobium sonneratiae]MCM2293189.1 ABC transporter ATP-binding protein [Allorhizobium sonneratiae]
MVLTIDRLKKSFETTEGPLDVLKGVSLVLHPGQSMALTGESGSGKSTLLHIAGGLEAADSGEVRVDGEDLASLDDHRRAALRRERIGLVFQQFNLLPSLDVAANLAFHARLAGRHDPVWVAELTERLGLKELLKRYPEQLSGGQQQRVAIGRSLALRPKLILADEPTGNLDEATGDAVMEVMLSLVRQTGAALLMVTHSQRLAQQLDHHLHLRAGLIV